ncbi:MAG TPA: tetratricopeptide repeat protein [Candidatus Acidoferrum sp.]|nr:tetratricopeptide repeat protein [Candidatus Acidoferrum sp.]
MILKVSIRGTRALLLLSLAATFFLSYYSIRTARAAHAVGLNTRVGYEQAVRLEPNDPQNWYLLGRFYFYDFDQPDPDAALRALLISRKLDPLSADTLLELATTYDDAGKVPEARAAFNDAKRVYPLSAEVRWRFGNFLLRQNEIPEAFAEIRKAVELDPKRGAEAFSRCSRVVSDPDEILDKAIPPVFESYPQILFDLAAEGKVDTALKVWSRAKELPGTIRIEEVSPLANMLVQAGRGKDAQTFWLQAMQKLPAPIPPDAAGSAIWDGGFESYFRPGGLGWLYEPQMQGVRIELDKQEKHSGAQSLRMMFLGRTNVSFAGVCHAVAVVPRTRYEFSAWVKTKVLTTEQGVRFKLESKGGVAVTQEVHGDQPWTNITMPWIAPDSEIAKVCVARYPSELADGDIQGTAWIDDVSLIPIAPAPTAQGRKQK